MPTVHQVRFQDRVFEFSLTYRKQKKIILRYREGQILVSAPYWCSSRAIKQFVLQNSEKLIQCQINYQKSQKISFCPPPWVFIFNQKFFMEFSPRLQKTKILANKILVRDLGDEQALTQEIYRFLVVQYKNWFLERTSYWAELMGVSFSRLTLRKMVSKWGVCYPKSQSITYNIKLIHYDPRIIDYVIVHELAHLIYPNHSSDFWRLVKLYVPNYQELKLKLRL